MEFSDLTIGTRVKTNKRLALFVVAGVFPAGTTGTVVNLEDNQGDRAAWVKLDAHFPGLDEWNNELCVTCYADEIGEVTERDFEPIA